MYFLLLVLAGSTFPTVQLLCCVPAVEGRWQHQNTKIHICTSYSPGIFHWLLRVFKWLWLSTVLMFLKSEDGHRKIAEWTVILVRNFKRLQRQQQTARGIFSSTAVVECTCGQSVPGAQEFSEKNQCQSYDSWIQKSLTTQLCGPAPGLIWETKGPSLQHLSHPICLSYF